MCEVGQALNKLAREQMKLRLLQDIRTDIEICKLEGMDYKEYLLELKDIVDGILKEGQANEQNNKHFKSRWTTSSY